MEISSAVALGELAARGMETVLDKKLPGLAFTNQLVCKFADDPYFRLTFLTPGIVGLFLGHRGNQAQYDQADERDFGNHELFCSQVIGLICEFHSSFEGRLGEGR